MKSMVTKKRRALISLLLAVMLMVLTACGGKSEDGSSVLKEGQSDLSYVQDKKTLVVGITDFTPMDYRSGDEWVGFDAELAEKFAESLGVSAELTEIDWDEKTDLLEKGTIDCIWNGMTLTEELQAEISCTDSYLSNSQVVVMPKEEMEKYSTLDECQHFLFALEEGSTGEALIKDKNYRYTPYATQKDALQSVKDEQADATVIDIIMASYYTSEGQDFSDLGFSIPLNDETICVGFRKDSDLTAKANEFIAKCYDDGTMKELAEKYGIEKVLLGEEQE